MGCLGGTARKCLTPFNHFNMVKLKYLKCFLLFYSHCPLVTSSIVSFMDYSQQLTSLLLGNPVSASGNRKPGTRLAFP